MTRQLRSTGMMQQAASKYNAEPPPFTGRHLWVYTAMWQVTEPARTEQWFDMENLVTLAGPVCFWCERAWAPTIGAHCPGDPSGGVRGA